MHIVALRFVELAWSDQGSYQINENIDDFALALFKLEEYSSQEGGDIAFDRYIVYYPPRATFTLNHFVIL